MQEYRELVHKGQEQFRKELESIVPEVKRATGGTYDIFFLGLSSEKCLKMLGWKKLGLSRSLLHCGMWSFNLDILGHSDEG